MDMASFDLRLLWPHPTPSLLSASSAHWLSASSTILRSPAEEELLQQSALPLRPRWRQRGKSRFRFFRASKQTFSVS